MSTWERTKGQMEEVAGSAIRKSAHALGNEKLAAKGGALQMRGKARRLKEKGKERLS
ncbi:MULTISPECIES: hypothetical protein [Streptomyces]|jgi:uncharacterized protein YjbJ (UPF0337 family)|uniref:Uncharacterized protein YjbJ (UPF0337 family) n=1 Tax=Streptomyces nymphaeiformis TaxID=2663842 RepID=A0A7W7XFY9_9ACTN|nr:hypothetical protein [Streptomyces nymphaeiformis]MBB4986777.1 uncharacterized protein YjbJ (UPF0337 family) [Streptomyces nymphaeiformis]